MLIFQRTQGFKQAIFLISPEKIKKNILMPQIQIKTRHIEIIIKQKIYHYNYSPIKTKTVFLHFLGKSNLKILYFLLFKKN